MASTTNSRAAGSARAIGLSVSALFLVQTWAAAQETRTYYVRELEFTAFGAPESMLLRLPGVQEELKLTDAQKKEHEAIFKRRLEKMQQIRGIKENARFQAARDALWTEIEAAVQTNLTPQQRQRLDQIHLQLMGPLGFAVPGRGRRVDLSAPLPGRLNLSADQVGRIKEVVDKGIPEITKAASFPLTLDATNGPPSDEAIRALVASPEFAAAKRKAAQAGRDARDAVIRRIEELLTDSQRTAYHALLGAPCDLSRLDGGPQAPREDEFDRRAVSGAYGIGGGQRSDPSFDTKVARPAYAAAAQRPRVLFDEAHDNFHTTTGRYKPFAELIASDGYRVVPNREKLTREVLDKGEILVIANALPSDLATGAAFTDAECDAVRDWVKDGGSLLLITDHAPFGPAAGPLAQRFGVDVSKGGATSDEANSVGDPTTLIFSRQNRLLGDHPITRGREDAERVNRIQTFTGTSLKGPEGSILLYKLADTAVDQSFNDAKPVSAAGRGQGLALSFGKGRVVVLGEAAELSAQLAGTEKFGMNVPGLDNRQMALNIMHWLSGLLEPREGELKKAG